MNKQYAMILILMVKIFFLVTFTAGIEKVFAQDKSTGAATIKLPAPKYSSDTSVEKALLERAAGQAQIKNASVTLLIAGKSAEASGDPQ